jgi:hypothetical protein
MTKSVSASERVPQVSSAPQAAEGPGRKTGLPSARKTAGPPARSLGDRAAGACGLARGPPARLRATRRRDTRPAQLVSLRQMLTVPTLGPGTDTLREARRIVSTGS